MRRVSSGPASTRGRWVSFAVLSAAMVVLPFGGFVGSAGAASAPPPTSARRALAQRIADATGGKARVAYLAGSDVARFVGTDAGNPVPRAAGVAANASAETKARGFLKNYGNLFGIADQGTQLRAMTGRTGRAVHFQQLLAGVPVLGGELAVDVRSDGSVVSASGETVTDAPNATTPTITAATAGATALASTAKAEQVASRTLTASTPQLAVYDNRVLGGPGVDRPLLVWQVDVRNGGAGDIDELVLVDATNGAVALQFNQVERAKTRYVCDRNNVVGGAEACTSAYTRQEGGAATGIADVDKAYDYAGITYDFYKNKFNRDSLDNAGLALRNTVRYCPDAFNCPFANAYWNGAQMVYGDSYATADDVVGHELSHGVTDHESHLYYWFQSGAINESLSDVFGELIDLTDGVGNDSAGVRWQMGEDLPIGAIRDMRTPGNFGDPASTQDPNYFSGFGSSGVSDNGGVHTNSGVNNKAASLLVDGGTLNGRTVVGIGIDKTARIYYKLNTDLLTSGSDYQDVSELLPQACRALVGTASITTTDCGQVTNAVLATQMNLVPANAPNPEAPVCNANQAPTNLFFDNLENTASGNWALSPSSGTNRWYYPPISGSYGDQTYTTSGSQNFYGPDASTTSDITITRTANVAIPSGNTYLRFNHAFDFEGTYDGGRVEYSTDNGGTWNDAGPLFTDAGYNANVSSFGGTAFTYTTYGYLSSRVNLSSLAGSNVRLRFHIKTDASIGRRGWWIDDVRVYRCTTSAAPVANAGADQSVNSGASFTLNGGSSTSPSGSLPLTYLWVQTSGTQAVINNDRNVTTTVNGVTGPQTLVFQLTVKDSNGQTSTDTVTVTVKAPK